MITKYLKGRSAEIRAASLGIACSVLISGEASATLRPLSHIAEAGLKASAAVRMTRSVPGVMEKRWFCAKKQYINQARFGDPTNDVAFKHLFKGDTSEAREITVSFLRAITGEPIESVTYKSGASPEIPNTRIPVQERRRQAFLDFSCEIQDGHKLIVEMQVCREDAFDARALFYAAGTCVDQLKKGGRFADLKKVIAVQILDFVNISDDEKPKPYGDFERHYMFLDVLHLEKYKTIPFLEIKQIELPLVNLNDLPLGTSAERVSWLRFFKEAYQQNGIPEDVPEIIRRAYERIEMRDWSKILRQEYEIASSIDVTRYTEVIGQAEKKGREEAKRILTINLLAENMTVERVAKLTGLSIEEINAIARGVGGEPNGGGDSSAGW